MATSFGVIAILDPVLGLTTFVLAIACMWLTRFVSAGSIMGAFIAGALVLVLPRPTWDRAAVLFLAALLVWQHRENIRKLQAGTERRLGEKVS